MPAWVQESALFTLAALERARGGEQSRLDGSFEWRESVVHDGVLFAHANPFGPHDWRYLNSADFRTSAADALVARGHRAGVFGHTHRRVDEERSGVRIFNPGSLGQPRDAGASMSPNTSLSPNLLEDGRSTLGILDTRALAWRTIEVDDDEAAHVASVRAASMSDDTKREIAKYHGADAGGGRA